MKKKDRRESKLKSSPAVPVVVPVWKSIVGWGICIWMVFVAFTFDKKFESSLDSTFVFFEGLADFSFVPFLKAAVGYLKSVSLFLLLVWGVVSWGYCAISRFLDEETPLLAKVVLSSLLGLICLSLLVTAAGFLGFLAPAALLVGLVVFSLSGFLLSRPIWTSLKTNVATFKWGTLFDSPAKILLLFLCGLAYFMAFVPEIFYDSLVYHLGLPQMFINEGRIIDTPNVYFSRSPMMIHMLYTLALGLDGSSLAKLINCFFFTLGIGSSFVVCGRLGWQKSAPWAALAFAAIPIVQMNVWTTAVDAAMGGLFAMAAYSILRWRESDKKIFWAVITGLLGGGVFAVKYPGLMVTGLLGLVLIILSVKRLREPKIILSLAIYGVLSGAVVSPWLVRNYLWTGNPVYPVLSSVFESRHMNHRKMENEKRITKRSAPDSVGALLTYPWRQTMLEISNFNFIGPMMLGLLPLMFLLPFKDPSVRVFTLITFGYFLLELQVLGELRYIMPGFLLLAVLLAGGLESLGGISKVCSYMLKTIFVGVALYQIMWIIQSLEGRYKPWPLILGKQSRGEYTATMHNGLNLWPWGVMADDIRKLPDPSRVYILGTEQVFGFPRRFWYSSVHDDTPLVNWANETDSGQTLYENLKGQGFTHILLNIPEAMRLDGYRLFPWTESGKKVFIDFANTHLSLVDTKPIAGYPNSLMLFQLKDKVDGPAPYGDFGVYFGQVLKLGAS